MMNEIMDSELNSLFVSPEKSFMGEPLAPYTEGSKLLLMQVRNDDDSALFFVWSFIFIHINLKKNRRDAINFCWNKSLFRERLFEWVSEKTEKDKDDATKLVSLIVEESNKGAVEIIGSGSPPGKE